MKKLLFGLFIAGSLLAAGCRTQIVTVTVDPADARIIANGVAYNQGSPMFVEASTGRQLAITAYKDGYEDTLYVIDYQLSTLGKIEAWCSILIIPAVFLTFDNAWELKENNVHLTLVPKSAPPAEKAKLRAAPRTKSAAPDAKTPVDQTTDPRAEKIFSEL